MPLLKLNLHASLQIFWTKILLTHLSGFIPENKLATCMIVKTGTYIFEVCYRRKKFVCIATKTCEQML